MKSLKPSTHTGSNSKMVNKIRLQVSLNGVDTRIECQSFDRALDVLRENTSSLSIKEGCGEGECGACSILLDGQLVNSCLVPAAQLDGASVETLEGFNPARKTLSNADDFQQEGGATRDSIDRARLQEYPKTRSDIADLSCVQKAFLQYGGAQCGICTPGMILAATQLLKQTRDPSLEQIREALAGNLCRCTGFTKIFASVLEAAKLLPPQELETKGSKS